MRETWSRGSPAWPSQLSPVQFSQFLICRCKSEPCWNLWSHLTQTSAYLQLIPDTCVQSRFTAVGHSWNLSDCYIVSLWQCPMDTHWFFMAQSLSHILYICMFTYCHVPPLEYMLLEKRHFCCCLLLLFYHLEWGLALSNLLINMCEINDLFCLILLFKMCRKLARS